MTTTRKVVDPKDSISLIQSDAGENIENHVNTIFVFEIFGFYVKNYVRLSLEFTLGFSLYCSREKKMSKMDRGKMRIYGLVHRI